jgi:tetratricopeptide (TPR) repeat protein
LASASVQKNADLAEAHVSLALVKMIFDWDWAGARDACFEACRLAPQLAEAHRYQAVLLSASSEHGPAETSARRACALEPLSLAAGTTLAWSLYLARDFAAAERQCWKMLMLEPRFSFAQTILGLVYEQQACYTEAIIELENARLCSGGEAAPAAALGHAFAVSGERAKALTILEQLSGAGGASRAIVYCGLGEHSVALESLERAIHERDPLLLWLNVDPRLDPLRSHSSFQKMLQRVGFTKYNYT